MISQTDTLEECYEYMLSFAARGLAADPGSSRDQEVRDHLNRAVEALRSLGPAGHDLITEAHLEPAEKYRAFFNVLTDDANRAATAIDLVLAQPTLTAPLIDNLNACMHLRALLTDLFLVTEILKPHPTTVAN